MKIFELKRIKISFSIISTILLIVFCSFAEEEDEMLSAGVDLSYVGPNMWAGFQLSNGPCIQPVFSFSVLPINVNLGVFMNIYGSERDRDKSSTSQTGQGITGKYKKGLGMCDEVQFIIDGGHDWNWFSLNGSLWYLAYTWNSTRYASQTNPEAACVWFGRMSSGELTISPSINIGPFSLFTDQCITVLGKKRKEEKQIGPNEFIIITKTPLGDYHGVVGISWSTSPVEQFSMDVTLKTEYATVKFLNQWLDSRLKGGLNNRGIEPYGFYHVTGTIGGEYNVQPDLTISGNFSVEYITNRWIRMNDVKIAKGCIPYAGMNLSYSFGW